MLSFFADFSDLMSPISLDKLTDNDVGDDDDINYINNSENKDQQQLKHYLQQHYIRCSRTMPICQIIQIRIKIEAKKRFYLLVVYQVRLLFLRFHFWLGRLSSSPLRVSFSHWPDAFSSLGKSQYCTMYAGNTKYHSDVCLAMATGGCISRTALNCPLSLLKARLFSPKT